MRSPAARCRPGALLVAAPSARNPRSQRASLSLPSRRPPVRCITKTGALCEPPFGVRGSSRRAKSCARSTGVRTRGAHLRGWLIGMPSGSRPVVGEHALMRIARMAEVPFQHRCSTETPCERRRTNLSPPAHRPTTTLWMRSFQKMPRNRSTYFVTSLRKTARSV